MSEKEFKDVECQFTSQFDPKTKKSLNLVFKKDLFTDVTADGEEQSTDAALFKLAAKHKLDLLKDKFPGDQTDQVVNISTKYQVLCPKTAFIGVIKLKNKPTEEAKKIEMPTISNALSYGYDSDE